MTLTGFWALVAIFIIIAIPVAIIAFLISKISKYSHRKNRLTQSVITTEYEPPEGLSPAELGYLFDSKFDEKEILATLLHMEQKGLITIDRDNSRNLIVKTRMTGDKASLKKHERYILDNLPDGISFDAYSSKNLSPFKISVGNSLMDAGYIKGRKAIISYYILRTVMAYLVIIALLLFLLFISASDDDGIIEMVLVTFVLAIIGFPFFLTLAVIASYIYNKIVGHPGVWTEKLKQTWPQIEGYKEYVRQVEVDRLRFESQHLSTTTKNESLPYAIALGLDTDWEKRF